MRIRLNRVAACLVVSVFVACAYALAADEQTNTVPADQAFDLLMKGNQHYVADQAQHVKSRPVGGAQTPVAAVVSCADRQGSPGDSLQSGSQPSVRGQSRG
jgi:hypothetical protein